MYSGLKANRKSKVPSKKPLTQTTAKEAAK